MSTVRHRDYQGGVEFEDGKLVLKILHIDDLITTEVDSASEVEATFAELVEDYLATCAELGKEPNKPFKGLFNVRIPPELHKQAAFAASTEDVTLNAYVIAALENKLATTTSVEQSGRGRPAEGFLRLSLVTCPVRLHPAVEGEHDLDGLEGEFQIEIDHFVSNEIDRVYFSNAYYLVPDGAVGADAFAVIRETMRAVKKVALARIVGENFEYAIALEVREVGMVATLLRAADQVLDPSDLFRSVRDVKVTKDMLDLAKHIVEAMKAPFDPRKLHAPKKRKKVSDQEPKLALSRTGGNVIDLMDALRRSARSNKTTAQGASKPRRKA